jgi:hypothetical protein
MYVHKTYEAEISGELECLPQTRILGAKLIEYHANMAL